MKKIACSALALAIVLTANANAFHILRSFVRYRTTTAAAIMAALPVCVHCGRDGCKDNTGACRDKWQRFSTTAFETGSSIALRKANEVHFSIGPDDVGSRHFTGLFNPEFPKGARTFYIQGEENSEACDINEGLSNNPYIRNIKTTSTSPLEVEFEMNISKCHLTEDYAGRSVRDWRCGDKIYRWFDVKELRKIVTKQAPEGEVTTKENVTLQDFILASPDTK